MSDNADEKIKIEEQGDEEESNTSSQLIAHFQRYAVLMKESQDKYERIFKIRRDITIESKRIIFLLHTIDKETKRAAVCAEAERRLAALVNKNYSKIAEELKGEDPYNFYRAISPGNQEFVEALTFLEYLQDKKLTGLTSCKKIPFMPTLDYVLGIADLTGELMRRCVSSLGTGDFTEVRTICGFLREIYIGMLGVSSGRDMIGKLHTLENSLQKVERICYNLHFIGNEAPKSGLTFIEPDHDIDEGYN